jgi:hypothetical protein
MKTKKRVNKCLCVAFLFTYSNKHITVTEKNNSKLMGKIGVFKNSLVGRKIFIL